MQMSFDRAFGHINLLFAVGQLAASHIATVPGQSLTGMVQRTRMILVQRNAYLRDRAPGLPRVHAPY